jgi:hypothetical protein
MRPAIYSAPHARAKAPAEEIASGGAAGALDPRERFL